MLSPRSVRNLLADFRLWAVIGEAHELHEDTSLTNRDGVPPDSLLGAMRLDHGVQAD